MSKKVGKKRVGKKVVDGETEFDETEEEMQLRLEEEAADDENSDVDSDEDTDDSDEDTDDSDDEDEDGDTGEITVLSKQDEFAKVKVVVLETTDRFLIGTEYQDKLIEGTKPRLPRYVAEHLEERGRVQILS
jgi:hypothetical protein